MWVWERKLSQKLSPNGCSNIISPKIKSNKCLDKGTEGVNCKFCIVLLICGVWQLASPK